MPDEASIVQRLSMKACVFLYSIIGRHLVPPSENGTGPLTVQVYADITESIIVDTAKRTVRFTVALCTVRLISSSWVIECYKEYKKNGSKIK